MNVNYKKGIEIITVDLIDFKKLAKSQEVASETIVFNHLVINKADFDKHWEGPAHSSWHNRFF